MTTNEVINLDYREKKNKIIIQKVLRKIKPLSKYPDGSEIPLNDLEKVITIISKKYPLRVRELYPDIWSNDKLIIWKATLMNETTFKVIGSVYGVSIYEVFAKIVIKLYSEIKKGNF